VFCEVSSAGKKGLGQKYYFDKSYFLWIDPGEFSVYYVPETDDK
jgi:hypothetical protein